MKRFLLFLLLGSLISCRQNDVGVGLSASDVLYRTWRLTQVSYDGQAVNPDQYITVVTFPRDGKFLRGTQKDNRWCWMPVSFKGTNAVVRFTWDTSAPNCAVINGRMSPLWDGIDWQITTLTNERLVLTGGKRTLTYEPVP